MQASILRRPVSAGLLFLAAAAAYAATVTYPDLRDELLKMGARDQEVRQATVKVFKSPEEFQQWSQIDANNRKRLKEIIGRYGWPTIAMVGKDGEQAAWLIAQHSDDDREFQRMVLCLIEPLTRTGEADPISYAYLYDRTHEPQRYGTQGDCVSRDAWQPFEIEDIAGVDERRRALGMPPLAEYAKRFDCAAPNTVLHDPADTRRTVPVPKTPSK